jgi:hypothetical protein
LRKVCFGWWQVRKFKYDLTGKAGLRVCDDKCRVPLEPGLITLVQTKVPNLTDVGLRVKRAEAWSVAERDKKKTMGAGA